MVYWIYLLSFSLCFGGIQASINPPNACNLEKRIRHEGKLFNMKKARGVPNIIPLAIIGSGPAGLSAALYGARSALYTVVFEGKEPGGLLMGTTAVENWPAAPQALGPDLMDRLKKQATSYGAVCVPDTIVNVDFSRWPFALETEAGKKVHALAVIIATGARPCFLNDSRVVPGEWDYLGRGVSTCAVCDALLYKGRSVAVVGGGDSAVEEAIYLSSYAQSVVLLVRGSALRASPVMQARLKELKQAKVLYTTQVLEILGDNTAVTGVKVMNTEKKETFEIPLDAVFLAIGHSPNSDIVKKWNITDKAGYIEVGPYNQRTRIPGVFAAGDVVDKFYRQAGVAAGDGIKAALDAYAFLKGCGYSQSFAQKIAAQHYIPEEGL